MNRRTGVALVAFVLWAAITVIGGNITTGGEASLLDGVTRGIGWTWLVAGAFILGVVLWQGWHDIGLNRWTGVAGWRLAWLPMVYIVCGLLVAALLGMPPVMVLVLLLINTLLVGFSEEVMFRGVLLQAFRNAASIWIAVLLTSIAFGRSTA
jgi:uncharacterized protein